MKQELNQKNYLLYLEGKNRNFRCLQDCTIRFCSRTIEHIFGYLVEIKGLQQWYGKFDQIEFDPNILECELI